MDPLRLKDSRILHLRDALRAAFAMEADFDELLLKLDRNLLDFAARADPYPTQILAVLRRANAGLWLRELLQAACETVQDDPRLRDFVAELGVGSRILAGGAAASPQLRGRELELKIKATQSTFDVGQWRSRLQEIEGRVCRIEFPAGNAMGTGFLVGPSLVMTNYHVIEPLKKGEIDARKLIARFDYKVLPGGVAVGEGRACRLAADWHADSSPYSQRDFEVADAEVAPTEDAPQDELDYALLRLAERASEDAASDGRVRGWIPVPAVPVDFARQRELYIVQHPEGKPMQVALDTEAVIGASATRVRYTTTTEPGSSGSPCFGADWAWVALHHSGDPKYYRDGSKPRFNQGIPVSAIVKLLAQRNKQTLLGASQAKEI